MNKKSVIKILTSENNIIKTVFHIKKIYLYGSYAKGNNTESSDIDIAIDIAPENKRFKVYIDLKNYLEQKLSTKVDLVFIESMNPIVKINAEKEMIEIE